MEKAQEEEEAAENATISYAAQGTRLNEFKKGYALAGFKTLNNMLSDIGKGGVIIKDVIPKIFPDPPKKLAPPMKTAAMESSRSGSPA